MSKFKRGQWVRYFSSHLPLNDCNNQYGQVTGITRNGFISVRFTNHTWSCAEVHLTKMSKREAAVDMAKRALS